MKNKSNMKTTIFFAGRSNRTMVQKTTINNKTMRTLVVYPNGKSESMFTKI